MKLSRCSVLCAKLLLSLYSDAQSCDEDIDALNYDRRLVHAIMFG